MNIFISLVLLFFSALIVGCDSGGAFLDNRDNSSEFIEVKIVPLDVYSQSLRGHDKLSIAKGSGFYVSAFGVLADGTEQDITRDNNVEWLSSEPSTLIVQAGRAVGIAPGRSYVSASYAGITSNRVEVGVYDEAVESIRVSPEILDIGLGERSRIRVIANYADKSTADVSDLVSWEVDDLSVVDFDGQFLKGKTVGTTDIRAVFGELKSNDVTITVWNRSLERVLVEPSIIELPVGASYRLSALAIYRDNDSGEYFTSDVSEQVFWTNESEDETLIHLTDNGVVVASHKGMPKSALSTLSKKVAMEVFILSMKVYWL